MTREQLLPPDILTQLPGLGEAYNQENPLAVVKFFYPDFSWTWYGIEFDGKDLFYGLVDGFELEYGSFLLSELMKNRGQRGMEIERDFYFTPTPAHDLYWALKRKRAA